ncbi:Fur family transcriptional regulator [Psychromicrobium sp. YIM B11713]|uniref:Fur family transcriptional regulator n=1 Tax=Psychromicrobium sp. YIM B11713 TaxID=3145233 RepID=UPI00374FAE07
MTEIATASTPGLGQPEWESSLRLAGRRVTKQRLTVLRAADSAPHLDAEHIWQTATAELPELTLQSVYTILADLTALGLLRKIDPTSGPARYETRVGDNHHHAICIRCGRIEDIDCAVGHAPCLEPSSSSMQILHAEVTFSGICADCAAQDSAVPHPVPEDFTPPHRNTTQGES